VIERIVSLAWTSGRRNVALGGRVTSGRLAGADPISFPFAEPRLATPRAPGQTADDLRARSLGARERHRTEGQEATCEEP
jgi:hypothetical protein